MRRVAIAAILIAGLPAAAAAQDANRAAALERVSACRAQSDTSARLACYDAAVAALDEAESSGELVVLDRGQVREARRGLFGFSVPSISLFDTHGDEDEEVIDNVSFTISRVRRVGPDAYVFTMNDGSVWRQLDQWRGSAPRSGQTAVVRRAAMGSFLMRVDSYPAVRVRREQ